MVDEQVRLGLVKGSALGEALELLPGVERNVGGRAERSFLVRVPNVASFASDFQSAVRRCSGVRQTLTTALRASLRDVPVAFLEISEGGTE